MKKDIKDKLIPEKEKLIEEIEMRMKKCEKEIMQLEECGADEDILEELLEQIDDEIKCTNKKIEEVNEKI